MTAVTDPHYLGAYWGPRAESAASCAERLAVCLQRLERCSPLLGGWYERADRRSEAAPRSVNTSPSSLSLLLSEGVNRRDADGEAMTHLGFSAGLWNRQSRAAVGLSVHCGASTASPGVMNSFVLDLPTPDEASQLFELGTARRMVEAVASAWEPDWATFTSYELHDAVDPAPRQPVPGWITYLSGARPAPADAAFATVEHSDVGALVVAADSLDALSPNRLQRLADDLEKAGSLEPTP